VKAPALSDIWLLKQEVERDVMLIERKPGLYGQ